MAKAQRVNRITVKVTDEEETAFEREAQRRHMTLSEFARQAMHAAIEQGKGAAWWEKKAAG